MRPNAWIPLAGAFLFGTIISEIAGDYFQYSTPYKGISAALNYEFPFSVMTAVIAGIGIAAATFSYFSQKLRITSASLEQAQSDLEIAKSKIHFESLSRYLDRTTRIPNELRWEEELEAVSELASEKTQYHLAMIDLNSFGALNNQIGYNEADKVIRFIAKDIEDSMRRNEYIFKLNFKEEETEDYYVQRIYRKFSGGDEFLFIIRGPEHEAIGFLNRIQKNQAQKYTRFARALGANWEFAFDAGVCQIQKGDTNKLARKRVEDCLIVARRKESKLRVFWDSELRVDNLDEKFAKLPDFAKKIYAEAYDLFEKQL